MGREVVKLGGRVKRGSAPLEGGQLCTRGVAFGLQRRQTLAQLPRGFRQLRLFAPPLCLLWAGVREASMPTSWTKNADSQIPTPRTSFAVHNSSKLVIPFVILGRQEEGKEERRGG